MHKFEKAALLKEKREVKNRSTDSNQTTQRCVLSVIITSDTELYRQWQVKYGVELAKIVNLLF
jgi:hypothetical protein